MGLLLKENIEHIKETEKNAREAYGQNIVITNYDGETDCPNCIYDPFYKVSKNPNCQICSGLGKIKIISSHLYKGIVDWATGEETEELAIGRLKIGQCLITTDIESKLFFENALINNLPLNIEGENIFIRDITPTILRTSLIVTGSKSVSG